MQMLTLRIENENALAAGAYPTFILDGTKDISIGRKQGNDWVLPDDTRHISGQHFMIQRYEGAYLVVDRSTNGTFLNGSATRVSDGHLLKVGDHIKVGQYVLVVEAMVEDPVVVSAPPDDLAKPTAEPEMEPIAAAQQDPIGDLDLFDDLLGDEPFDSGAADSPDVPLPAAESLPPDPQIPEELEPLVPELDLGPDAGSMALPPHLKAAQSGGGGKTGVSRTSSDNAAAMNDATSAGRGASATQAPDFAELARQAGSGNTTSSLARPPIGESSAPPEPQLENATPQDDKAGDAPAEPEKAPPKPAATPDPNDDPFAVATPAAEEATPSPAPAKSGGPFGGNTDLGESFTESGASLSNVVDPIAEPSPKKEAVAPRPADTPPAPTPTKNSTKEDSEAFLRAFLKGAGLPQDTEITKSPERVGYMAGEALRVVVDVVKDLLKDRAATKYQATDEDRTMITTRGNNPLKITPDSEDAFVQLFLNPREGYLSGADGFENALADIRRHQIALVAAIQPSFAEVLEGLSPEEITDGDDGGGKMLGGGRANKRHWEEFLRRWKERMDMSEDPINEQQAMQDAFIKAFSRHYSEAASKF